jgi:hypothetical protein
MSAPGTRDRGPRTGKLRGTPLLHGFFSPARQTQPTQRPLSEVPVRGSRSPVPEGAHR